MALIAFDSLNISVFNKKNKIIEVSIFSSYPLVYDPVLIFKHTGNQKNIRMKHFDISFIMQF